ncbi:endothelial cell-selective adhesion molecule-like isoform X1 [Lates japonicus]|uniref:Endothelial cell-selective adhesion molecule-like isoform X1 n=1 Tax=Lates japonicus TaxID=270547 RepID=A0AAD3MFX5_LATJO|nr:endothelial cell-selective adhesion molecule-like isoform X1 [Lates japonicus]
MLMAGPAALLGEVTMCCIISMSSLALLLTPTTTTNRLILLPVLALSLGKKEGVSGRTDVEISAACDTQKVEIPKGEMEVVKGQMVVLQAWYSPNSDISKNSVVWLFMGNGSEQVINFSSGEVGHGQNEYTKRVGFSAAMPSANLSIYINNTQESDSGRYICNVIIPGGTGITGEVHLNVKVPPSPPVCSITGNPVVKGNVTLSCKSSHGKPVPQYKWTKAAPISEVFFSPMQSEYFLSR